MIIKVVIAVVVLLAGAVVASNYFDFNPTIPIFIYPDVRHRGAAVSQDVARMLRAQRRRHASLIGAALPCCAAFAMMPGTVDAP